ncbi:MAG: hypothetical protein HY286_13505 [Planctomycetes bacterium]|nr:hypothetical protein [Planctomycetota bacterium]
MTTIESIHAKSALTPTGGFLKGFTHTFSPAIGCLLGKSSCGDFCYAQFLQAHQIHGKGGWGEYLLIKANAAEALRADLDRAARRAADHKYYISKLRVFSASSTEPLAGPLLTIYRDCLRVLADYDIASWVVQTRSPLVRTLQNELDAIRNHVVVSMTIETDDDASFQIGAAGSPTIAARRAAVEEMQHWPVPIHVAVSPALPMRNINDFARWLLQFADVITVDTAVSGDGTGDGSRSARSALPSRMAARGADWRDERQPRELYQLLEQLAPGRARWSSDGFTRLARIENVPRRHS